MRRAVQLELSEPQAERLLDQLAPAVKIRLVRRWGHQTRSAQFRTLVARIDARLRRNPRLAREAMKVVGPARRALYARRARH